MYIKTTKQLFAALIMLSAIFAQNDGLVVTKYDNGGIKVEGNYTNGVRNGAWAEYWEEVCGSIMAKTENQTPKTP